MSTNPHLIIAILLVLILALLACCYLSERLRFTGLKIIRDLKKAFVVKKFTKAEGLLGYLGQKDKTKRTFGLYLGERRFYGLGLQPKSSLAKDLDVNILHNVIIERIFNITPAKEDLYYTRDAEEAVELVEQAKYQAAFFLQPATVTQVKKVALGGEKMPHKSTYFYPKLLTGLVINRFNQDKS